MTAPMKSPAKSPDERTSPNGGFAREHPVLSVHTSTAAIRRYKSLLQTEFSRRTIEDTLSLLWDLVHRSPGMADFPVRELLDASTPESSAREVWATVIGRIRELAD